MKILEGKNVPIKSWCNNPEDGAIKQAKNLASLPFIFKHVALMSDTHCGYGMPIGGVIATTGVVIPNAVGVDIGCGMIVCNTNIPIERINKEVIKKIFGGSKEYKGGIRSYVPVGFNHQSKKQDEKLMPSIMEHSMFMDKDGDNYNPNHEISICEQEYQAALKQIGTLGGGNHFIELQTDGKTLWVMVHSGSRNLGYKVARHYNDIAIKLNEKWYSTVPKTYQLAFLPLNSEEATDYLREMNYCVDFALANRKTMMDRILDCIKNILGDFKNDDMINIAHNYARLENHFGKNLVVHRKGATSAKKDQLGIIPGSQGSCSYIVRGKGNIESFMSCSHGAGRKMSRTKAKETLNLEDEINKMDKQGIVHGIRHKNDLDEVASSYKDIDVVMEEQKDLVEIVTKLTPLGVIKG